MALPPEIAPVAELVTVNVLVDVVVKIPFVRVSVVPIVAGLPNVTLPVEVRTSVSVARLFVVPLVS